MQTFAVPLDRDLLYGDEYVRSMRIIHRDIICIKSGVEYWGLVLVSSDAMAQMKLIYWTLKQDKAVHGENISIPEYFHCDGSGRLTIRDCHTRWRQIYLNSVLPALDKSRV